MNSRLFIGINISHLLKDVIIMTSSMIECEKKAIKWMLNIGSPWTITNAIKASAPDELLLHAINDGEGIPDDWWITI